MNKYRTAMLVIAAIGAAACLISFIIALVKGSLVPGIIFGLAFLFCLGTAVGALKRR